MLEPVLNKISQVYKLNTDRLIKIYNNINVAGGRKVIPDYGAKKSKCSVHDIFEPLPA